ncbi:uncharacterized protein LOC130664163 [Microplitis mediator]|uniref:uncharacterized protein LOC130664163 n=1 Tax=Microplitis mediator TaxID=375433 RepID=UPI00255765B6|nr:uncharacterized protein LOC130664163 [Microplitis mediator]
MDNNNSYTIVLTIIVILIFIIYYYLTEKQKYWEKRGVPVIKSSVPFIGNIWPVLIMRKSVAQLYEECYKSASQCSMVGLYNVGEPELLIRDPELIKIIFQTSFTSFEKNGIEINPELDPLASRNPFFLQGERWKQERSVLSNNMSSGKLKNMSLSVRDVCIEFKNYINKEIKSSGDGKSIEVEAQELFARFTSAFIAKAGFGIDGNCFSNQSDNFFEIAKMMFSPSSFDVFKTMIVSIFPSLNNIIKTHFISPKIDHYFRGVVNDILESRKKNNTRGNDFVQHLSDTYKYNESNNNDDGKRDMLLSIASHASSFLIDGYLTSGLTLMFVTYHIADNPDVQNKLRKEIKETLNKYNNEITYDAIQDLKYMDLVIKESMRMLPVTAILQKVCTQEFKFVGFDNVECTVKPGTKIIIPLQEVQKDEEYWQDSDKFDPERFNDENKSNQHKFVYLPFGAGPRVCVGQRMALLQMKGALTVLLDNFSLEISQKTKQPLVWSRSSMFNLPEDGIWINIKPLTVSKMDSNFSYTIVLTIIVSLIFIIYYYLMEKQKHWEKRGVPVIKSSVPYIGNVWPVFSMRKGMGQLYKEFYKSTSQYSMVGLYNIGEPELLIRDPELIKIVLQTNFSSFDKNVAEIDPKLDPLLSRNPFFLQGEKWKQERSILTNNMSSGKLKNMSLSVRDVCIEFKNYINKEIKSSGDGKSIEVDAQELFARFTSAFIAKAGFGIDGNCFSNQSDSFFVIAKTMFNPTSLDAFKIMIVSIFPSLNNIIKTHFLPPKIDDYFCGIVNDILESRKKNYTWGNDFVQHLSDTYKYNESNNNDDEKKDILISIAGHALSFLIDGYFTSSLTLTYITYYIAKYPDVQNKVRKEIKETLNKYNNEITYDGIQELKYMDLVIKESMRMLPVTSILQKKCTKDFKFVGFDNVECTVKPGTKITIPLEEMQKDEKYWQDPDEFDPERFNDENKSNQHKFVYLPFGGGPRICVGQRMALLQIKGALTVLLDNFSLEISQKTKQPLVWTHNSVLNIPEGGVWINIKPL